MNLISIVRPGEVNRSRPEFQNSGFPTAPAEPAETLGSARTGSERTRRPDFGPNQLVMTPSTKRLLRELRQAVDTGHNVTLGVSNVMGAGPLIRMALGPSSKTYHADSLANPQELVGLYEPSSSGAGFEFHHSSFSQAAASGQRIILPHLEQTAPSVRQFLNHVLEHGECPPTMQINGKEIPVPPEHRFRVHPDTVFVATTFGPKLSPDVADRFRRVEIEAPDAEGFMHFSESLTPHLTAQQRACLGLFQENVQRMARQDQLENPAPGSLRTYFECCQRADELAAQGDERALATAVGAVYFSEARGADRVQLLQLGLKFFGPLFSPPPLE